jgi:ubiquinone/menaquinone biosynthesis C-methylase UbiE
MKREVIDHYQKTWKEYDDWYDAHQALYQSELAALKKVVPSGTGLEIGVGTGRFAAPLAVRFGLDPVIQMIRLAKKRGVQVVQGFGENLPFKNESFHFVQIVLVLEFIDNPAHFLKEAARTVRQDGALILGFIDRESAWGTYYSQRSSSRELFHPPSTREILELVEKTGLEFQEAYQTLFEPPPDLSREEEPKGGFGEGSFVVLKAGKRVVEPDHGQ